ncbi:methyltransferase type 11 [Pullulanibacillus camelliae]|uniref:Methyltransferase type 11 n=1 Tax=Pullulanibacillus camelliae TaxID=1707096 RepID=A0A8J3E026_9BACL|nr:class I SAM-dependent methyltransferase [Pullulanibacillus camelliae]GGE52691.1 methyltransferase type 11 [Pullulanibacillus camelliae]
MSHEHRFNPEKAGRLLDPNRKKKLPPDEILALLGLERGDVVADLGSGNGFFTVPIAQKTETTVYAVDIEPKMLEGLKVYADQEEVKNIQTVTSDLIDIDLPDDSVDKIFSSLVMHEVSDLNAMLSEMKRILRVNGKLLILDWEAVEMNEGPPLKIRIPSEKLKALFEEQQFQVKKQMVSPEVYALVMSI